MDTEQIKKSIESVARWLVQRKYRLFARLCTGITFDRTNAVVKYCMQSFQLQPIVPMVFLFLEFKRSFSCQPKFSSNECPHAAAEPRRRIFIDAYPKVRVEPLEESNAAEKFVFELMIIFFAFGFSQEILVKFRLSHLQCMTRNSRRRANAWRAFQ